ncbi:vacuolar cation/proton exchanger 3-like [Pyrus communis]|uniref:vacuolar cation/proton exchanger 3-like n=1 Tax=Pyrus communis TaxID=23211 RepID=UPI0035C047EA
MDSDNRYNNNNNNNNDNNGRNNDAATIKINSHAEMGSTQPKSVFEFEDQSLVGGEKHSLDEAPLRDLYSGGANDCCPHVMNSVVDSIRIVVFSAQINLLMPFGPLAIVVDKLTGHHGWVFLLSLLGIIPLAERLGYATEQLACYTGPTVGGLLNATFGNATELIISIYALKRGMIRVVQQSLLGSILSNMLLVLGCAFFSGGLVHSQREQVFNKATSGVNSGLLLMAVMGLLFPAVLHSTRTELHYGKSELSLSRFTSCIMLVAYASYLFFQLRSQQNLYIPVDQSENHTEENSDDEEAPEISKWESIIWLSILTVVISVLSEYLVNAIEGASVAMSIPVAFISVILLPIVGNAAEHAGAVMFAMKDKLDITLGVAIGSSTQISMFGIPFCVVVGWFMGCPMDLDFQLFETATLFITVLVVAFMLQGTSNYFKGLMLILCYIIVAASFFVHRDPKVQRTDDDRLQLMGLRQLSLLDTMKNGPTVFNPLPDCFATWRSCGEGNLDTHLDFLCSLNNHLECNFGALDVDRHASFIHLCTTRREFRPGWDLGDWLAKTRMVKLCFQSQENHFHDHPQLLIPQLHPINPAVHSTCLPLVILAIGVTRTIIRLLEKYANLKWHTDGNFRQEEEAFAVLIRGYITDHLKNMAESLSLNFQMLISMVLSLAAGTEQIGCSSFSPNLVEIENFMDDHSSQVAASK